MFEKHRFKNQKFLKNQEESTIKNQEFISHKTSYNYLQANNSIQMNNTNKETCESKNRRGMGRR